MAALPCPGRAWRMPLVAAAAVLALATHGQAQVFRCLDVPDQRVTAVSYLVALEEPSVDHPRAGTLRGKATVLIAGRKTISPFYPVVEPGYIQCKQPIRTSTERRDIEIAIAGDDDEADDVLHDIRANPAARIGGAMPRDWPAFLPFGAPAPIPPGFNPQESGRLFREYFLNRRTAEFLGPGVAARVSGDGIAFETTAPAPGPDRPDQRPARPAGDSLNWYSAPPAAEPPRGRPAPQAETRPAPAAPSPSPNLAEIASGQIVQKRITLRFRNKAAWKAIRLEEPGVVETFEYCQPPSREADGSYTLQCNTVGDGRIPLRIRGFETLLLGANEPALDEKLKVVGYTAPYPARWKRAQSELIEVPGGALAQVMSRRISVTQGFDAAACRSEIAAISIKDIIDGTLSFPEPPCQSYVVALPPGLLSPQAAITANCLPGNDARVAIGAQGTATCWLRGRQGSDVELEAQLAPGFKPVRLPIPRSQAATGHVTLDAPSILRSLEPVWPYAPGLVEPGGETPAYAPRSVRYVAANGTACEALVRAPPGSTAPAALPSLEAAGCTQLPRRMEIRFEQAGAATAGGAPPEAFRQMLEDPVPIDGSQTGQRRIPLAAIRQALRVGFSPEDAARYAEQFGAPAGNTTFPGIHLFPGECSGTRNGSFLRFGAVGEPRTWPVYAAVYDGRSDEPLTRCARAEIGRDPQTSSAPFLTFRLEAARAAGPRRAIVISTSQKFLSGGGSVPALTEALQDFAQQLHDAYAKRGAPLSPVTVFLVNGGGDYVPLFNGEAAAFDVAKVKQTIRTNQELMAPNTPDFATLDYAPEIKAAGIERVMFVTEGSDIGPANLGTLARFINRLARSDPGNVVLLVSAGTCSQWQAETANFQCRNLPPGFQRKAPLAEAFAHFITQRAQEPLASPGREPRPERGRQP